MEIIGEMIEKTIQLIREDCEDGVSDQRDDSEYCGDSCCYENEEWAGEEVDDGKEMGNGEEM